MLFAMVSSMSLKVLLGFSKSLNNHVLLFFLTFGVLISIGNFGKSNIFFFLSFLSFLSFKEMSIGIDGGIDILGGIITILGGCDGGSGGTLGGFVGGFGGCDGGSGGTNLLKSRSFYQIVHEHRNSSII